MLQTAALEKQVEFQKARLESLQSQRDSALEAAEQVNQLVKKEVPLAFLCRVVGFTSYLKEEDWILYGSLKYPCAYLCF